MLGLQAIGRAHFFSYVSAATFSVPASAPVRRLASVASMEPGTLEAPRAWLKVGCGVTRSMDLALEE